MDEIDELLQSAVRAQQDDARRWWFLWDAARNYMQIPKQGVIVAGKFYRGNHRGGDGRWANAAARDRVRARQSMAQAPPNARKDDNHRKVSDFLGPGRHAAEQSRLPGVVAAAIQDRPGRAARL